MGYVSNYRLQYTYDGSHWIPYMNNIKNSTRRGYTVSLRLLCCSVFVRFDFSAFVCLFVSFFKKFKIVCDTLFTLLFYFILPALSLLSLHQEFRGNSNLTDIKKNLLKPSIVTRRIRIFPTGYQSFPVHHVCLRAELYGCRYNLGKTKIPSFYLYSSFSLFDYNYLITFAKKPIE